MASTTASRAPCGHAADCLGEMAARESLHQLARVTAGGGRSAGGHGGHLVRRPTQEDRSPGRHADGDADLAECVVDPGGHAAALLGHDTQRHIGDDRVEQTDSDTGEEEPGQELGPARPRLHARHQQQSDAGAQQPERHQHPRVHPAEQYSGQRRDEEAGQRHRQVPEPGLQRRVAEVILQVQRQVQEQREQRRRHREGRELHAGERATAEQLEREHRLRDAALDEHKRHQQPARRPRTARGSGGYPNPGRYHAGGRRPARTDLR